MANSLVETPKNFGGRSVEVAPYKRDPGDFVPLETILTRPSRLGQSLGPRPARLAYRCSAMSWRYLGETFDIHGGGTDLIFPHHENEVAQSLCAFPGSQFARYWVHNGMLLVDGEKMANPSAISQRCGTRCDARLGKSSDFY